MYTINDKTTKMLCLYYCTRFNDAASLFAKSGKYFLETCLLSSFRTMLFLWHCSYN